MVKVSASASVTVRAVICTGGNILSARAIRCQGTGRGPARHEARPGRPSMGL